MSITISRDVFCDGCQNWETGVVNGSSAEARTRVSGGGWTTERTRPGGIKDYCPACSEQRSTQGGGNGR